MFVRVHLVTLPSQDEYDMCQNNILNPLICERQQQQALRLNSEA